MLSFLLGLTKILPNFVTGLFGWLNKKQDTAVVENNNAANVSVALVQNDTAHAQAIRDVTTAMFSHPVFWVAWSVGVFPVLMYHAAIFFVSTFPMLGWTVLKVPAAEMDYAHLIVGSVFTLTGASTLVSGLAHAWMKRV
jgi:hypothetical protein